MQIRLILQILFFITNQGDTTLIFSRVPLGCIFDLMSRVPLESRLDFWQGNNILFPFHKIKVCCSYGQNFGFEHFHYAANFVFRVTWCEVKVSFDNNIFWAFSSLTWHRHRLKRMAGHFSLPATQFVHCGKSGSTHIRFTLVSQWRRSFLNEMLCLIQKTLCSTTTKSLHFFLTQCLIVLSKSSLWDDILWMIEERSCVSKDRTGRSLGSNDA